MEQPIGANIPLDFPRTLSGTSLTDAQPKLAERFDEGSGLYTNGSDSFARYKT